MSLVKHQIPYTKGYILGVVVCQNCLQTIQPKAANVCLNNNGLWAVANAAHSQIITQSKIICSNPKLLVNFSEVLLDNSLVTELPNGNNKN
jgi:hypothetical protein